MGEPHVPRVSEIMVSDPVTVTRRATAQDAARLMSERNIGCVVVCEDGVPTGIFTERDLLRQVALHRWWKGVPVAKFMTPDPITVRADDTLHTVGEILGQNYVRHLPVTQDGKLVGILSVRDMMRNRARYLEWLVQERTAELRANNAALEERDRVMRHHLEFAGRTQRQMLPPASYDCPPLSLAVAYHPFDRVSGDYFDFARLSESRLGILIADAAGHSVPAALVSVMVKSAFHVHGRTSQSPAALLETMNDHLLNLVEGENFVTMFYAVADLSTLQLTYALAGHPAPLWHRRGTQSVVALDSQGIALGVAPGPHFEENAVELESGDVILFYTDGVSECRNRQKELFGRARIEAFLSEHAASGSQALVQELDADIERFRGPQPPGDDVTCIALSVGQA